MNILLIRLSSVGDIIHGVPVAAALRESFPHAIIDWLVESRYQPAANLCAAINNTIPVELLSIRGSGGLMETIRQLRRTKYDLAIDLQGLLKSALFGWLSHATEVLGFIPSETREAGLSVFYTRRFDPTPFRHVVEKNLNLLGALNIRGVKAAFPLNIPSPDMSRTGVSGPFAIIHPGSSTQNKLWPEERFGELARLVRNECGLEVLLVGGPGESLLCERIARIAERDSIHVVPPLPLSELAGIITTGRVFIGCDAGPTHLAAAIGTPVVAIHGPTDPRRNGPWGQESSVVSRFRDCECKFRRKCRRDQPCMSTIGVQEVLGMVIEKLSRPRPIL